MHRQRQTKLIFQPRGASEDCGLDRVPASQLTKRQASIYQTGSEKSSGGYYTQLLGVVAEKYLPLKKLANSFISAWYSNNFCCFRSGTAILCRSAPWLSILLSPNWKSGTIISILYPTDPMWQLWSYNQERGRPYEAKQDQCGHRGPHLGLGQ